MTTQVFKSIAIGVLAGAVLFFAPFFLLRFLLFFLLVGLIVRFFVAGRFRRGWEYGFSSAFADKIRNMTDEEYAAFKHKTQSGCHLQNKPETA